MSPQSDLRNKVRCPECLAAIWLKSNIELGDPVTCPECHTALEVTRLKPLTLDFLEDWDEDEDDFFEYEEED